MPWTHGVTQTQVEQALHGYEGRLTSIATRIAELLNSAGSEVEVAMRAQGYTAEFATGSRGYYLAREVVTARVAAGALRTVVQAQTEFAAQFDARATELLRQLRQTPEVWDDAWDSNTHAGSWRSNVTLTPSSPSSTALPDHWTRGGF